MAHHHGGGSSGGMDMGGMGDMDDFQPVNMFVSRLFWYFVTTVVAVGLIGNVLSLIDGVLRRRRAKFGLSDNPTVPHNWFWQTDATIRTVLREMSYPQGWYIKSAKLSLFSPPSLGKCLFILGYWIMITIMLTTNSITNIQDPYYFERIGYRAAWVSVMQIPLIIILAGRTNIVGFLIGSSYERLNWAHRWIARTLLVCIAVHAGFFLRQWIRADFLETELEILPLVKYGMGAAGVILWMNLSGLPYFRHIFYEFFVIQHLASIAAVLWLLHKHVPSYAMHFIWMAIGFLAFDRVARLIWLTYRNIHIISNKGLGYHAELQASPGGVTKVVIRNVSFRWSAGQHIYIWIPRMGFPESHPFTISNACPVPSSNKHPSNDIELQVRAHSGFSKRLLTLASRPTTNNNPHTVKCLIQGPYGSFPQWNTFDTLLLVAASTGASFTLPIFESILQDPCCVRRLHFLLLVRERPQCSCYLSRLRALARENKQIEVSIHIAITQSDDPSAKEDDGWEGPLGERCCCGDVGKCYCGSEDAAEFLLTEPANDEKRDFHQQQQQQKKEAPTTKSSSTSASSINSKYDNKPITLSVVQLATSQPTDISFVPRRPALDRAIRDAIEHARGETGVVVCGGKSLSGYVRNSVAALSDERAVHKGSGAQGIVLHVEEFGF